MGKGKQETVGRTGVAAFGDRLEDADQLQFLAFVVHHLLQCAGVRLQQVVVGDPERREARTHQGFDLGLVLSSKGMIFRLEVRASNGS